MDLLKPSHRWSSMSNAKHEQEHQHPHHTKHSEKETNKKQKSGSETATIMVCEIGLFPTKYLDLPVGGNFKAVEVWNKVIEKK